MKIDRHFWLLAAFLVGLEGLVAYFAIDRPPWGDEEHFVETIRLFGRQPTLHTLRTYPEMNAPLPFILYAIWGRVVGFELPTLRVLSLLIALVTYGSFYGWVCDRMQSTFTAAALTVFLAIQPYMVGFSIFVFTDMLAILCLIWGCWAVSANRPLGLFMGIAGALLCRQYMAFLALGMAGYFVLRWWQFGDRRDVGYLAIVILATLPLIGLFVFWQGTCPDNSLRAIYLSEPLRFHPEALSLYLGQITIYMVPLVILCWQRIYSWRALAISGVIGSLWYARFPIRISATSIAAGLHAVGYFDRFMQSLVGLTGSHIMFCIALCCSLPIVWAIGLDCLKRLRSGELQGTLLGGLVVAAFLVVMPISYLTWEKYFMPLVPVLAAEWLAWFPRPLARVQEA